MSGCSNVSRSTASALPDESTTACPRGPSDATELLPLPAATADDLMTSISILTMKQKQNDRTAADQQRVQAEKNQEEAQAQKIEKMRELARDTFLEGLVSAVLEGASSAMAAASAVEEFNGKMLEVNNSGELTQRSVALTRNGKLLEAGSRALSGSSRLGGAVAKSAQEDDRTDIALADRAVERAKSAVDAASTASRRAEDDIRETLNAVRQYLAAKTQAAQAGIIKG
ncbi:MAG: hypothetical protein JWP87_3720 [Labilithrix sp.]|nr:hypothetical protein [Labilithrix sp.]